MGKVVRSIEKGNVKKYFLEVVEFERIVKHNILVGKIRNILVAVSLYSLM